jgi:acid phosphatase
MDEPMRRDVEGAAVAEWFNGYIGSFIYAQLIVENETYRRLGVGPLLGDVIDRFTFAATNTSAQKMALYGTHDTTIAALLATLGVFDDRWPCFTSNITFELFQEEEREDSSLSARFLRLFSSSTREPFHGYFVRTKYNQTVVTLPGLSTLLYC